MKKQANSNPAPEGEVYQGGLIDQLLSTVEAVVPACTPRQPSWNGLLLTIDEVLARVERGGR